MATVRKVDGIYAYGAEKHLFGFLNTYLGMSEEGASSLFESTLTNEAIDSPAFTEALTAVMTEVNATWSIHAGDKQMCYSADFACCKSAAPDNGAWAAGGTKDNKAYSQASTPGVAISAAGGGDYNS